MIKMRRRGSPNLQKYTSSADSADILCTLWNDGNHGMQWEDRSSLVKFFYLPFFLLLLLFFSVYTFVLFTLSIV